MIRLGWNGLEWIEMDWNVDVEIPKAMIRLGWNGLKWIGMDWNAL
jgi:hypothetical protein